MTDSDPKRKAWEDYRDNQKFEHELLDRKTTWLLATQSILFAAYGIALSSDTDADAGTLKDVITFGGFWVSAILLIANTALIYSKLRSFIDYRNYFKGPSNELPEPLNRKWLQWGVRTWITPITLLPDLALPAVFLVGWIFLGKGIIDAALL